LLAQPGIDVLVHGPASDPGRVTTAEVFHHLGLQAARDAADVGHAWARREPAFIGTETWCPPLQRLLDVRRIVGLRNSGHTVAKLIAPDGPEVLRVINHTHPEYAVLTTGFCAASGASALLLRGTEGEPVADPRRRPRLDVVLDGTPRADLSRPAHEGVLSELPVLPRECDAATTANYVQSVISGEKPAPGPLLEQAETLLAALQAMRGLPHRVLMA
jgi:anthranilate phosphoribosyltransferase